MLITEFSRIQQIINIATQAGDLIMDFYDRPTKISIKKDNSPVTDADIAANDFIVKALYQLIPDIPVIAEENNNNQTADIAGQMWLVDPIDATSSFISKHGEFTVNIALVDQNNPIFGVIYAPLPRLIYYNVGNTAYRQKRGAEAIKIHSRKTMKETELIVLVSSQYNNERTKQYISNLKITSVMPVSSSIKFCLIAEGSADIYPRLGKTMEWDTAAGHAILKAAGGRVTDIHGKDLSYGKENFINDFFIASGSSS